MKRSKLFICILAVVLTLFFPTGSTAENDKNILPDAFITTLYPHINNAVVGHYGEHIQYALYNVEIISIKRTQSGRSFGFNVTLKIFPFERAHLYIGADTLTLEVDSTGINVTSYVHEEYK